MINTQVYDFWHVNCVHEWCGDLASPPWSRMQTLSMSVRTGSELRVPSAVGWQVGEETCCCHPISLKVFWQLSLDKELIDFGSYTVGETAIRTITLTNTGGLGTKFRFLLASESCEMDTSQSALKLVSVLLLLVNAVAAQPRAARGIFCPRYSPMSVKWAMSQRSLLMWVGQGGVAGQPPVHLEVLKFCREHTLAAGHCPLSRVLARQWPSILRMGASQTPQAEKVSKLCPAPIPLSKVWERPWSSHGKAVHMLPRKQEQERPHPWRQLPKQPVDREGGDGHLGVSTERKFA